MPIQILPAQESDIPTLVHVFLTAFENDPLVGRLKAGLPEQVRFEKTKEYFLRLWAGREVYGARFLKAVDFDEADGEEGKIVGFAKWQYPHHLTEGQIEGKRKDEEKQRQREHPEGMNVGLYDEFYRQLREGRERWIDHERTFFLRILAILPTHQRRGIGTQLIAPGLAAADAANAKTYIEATAIGLPLYIRLGWVIVAEMRIDLDRFGYPGKGVCVQKFLVREPGGGRKEEGGGVGGR